MEQIRGRAITSNPRNRFERIWIDADEPPARRVRTEYLRDKSRSIIARNDSPDVGFDASINPYRGCEHGCAYCYARPTHEYLGLSAGLDFESRILVKEQAPSLLRTELSSPRWHPRTLTMSGVTDPYQPIERQLRLTRGCLEVLAEFRNPVAIITKNELVTRDIDHLARLAKDDATGVFVSVTTLDTDLARRLEPRASAPARRLNAIRELARAGIPAGVMVAPVIPGLTDHEIPRILSAAAQAGATRAGTVMLRLPGVVADGFAEWLDTHLPTRKGKILARLRSIRGGRLNDPDFGSRMRGSGPFADQAANLFAASCRRFGLATEPVSLSSASFRRNGQPRLPLFDI